MLFVCGIKRIGVDNGCVHLVGRVPDLARVHQLLDFARDLFGNFFLLVIVAEDDGSVLGSHIVALTVEGGGVVELKEEANQRLKRFGGVIQLDPQDLDVSRGTRTDLYGEDRKWTKSKSY